GMPGVGLVAIDVRSAKPAGGEVHHIKIAVRLEDGETAILTEGDQEITAVRGDFWLEDAQPGFSGGNHQFGLPPLAGFEVEADSHQVVPKLPEFFERLRVSAAEIEVASIGRPGRPGFVSARRGDGWREEERVGID